MIKSSRRFGTIIAKQPPGGLRLFLLNRPEAFNALTLEMVVSLGPQLLVRTSSLSIYSQTCQYTDAVKCVMLTNAPGSKAFCAGGDVKAMYELGMRDTTSASESQLEFFHEEYKLNHLIGTLNKPVVAVLDVGGGVGLSVHAPFRVATENTLFAMPENKIGLFPDVGASFFLSRLEGELGTYLGLTGKILKGKDVVMAGLATHYITSDRLPELMLRLSTIDSTSLQAVNQTVDAMSEHITRDEWDSWPLGQHIKTINECFRFNTLEQIIASLTLTNTVFSKETLKYIHSGSPTSCKITLRQLRKGAKMHFRDCFKMEYNLARQCMVHILICFIDLKNGVDFYEGVRAQLVDKDKHPVWSPTWERLDTIPDSIIEKSYFSPVPSTHMQFKSLDTYYAYPHRTLSAFPTTRDLMNVVNGTWESDIVNSKAESREEVLNIFRMNWGGVNEELMDGSNNPPKSENIDVRGVGKGGLDACVHALLDRSGLWMDKKSNL